MNGGALGDGFRTPRILSWLLLMLMAIQSATGLLFTAIYLDVAWIKATWFGNDLVTLSVAVPLLLAGLLLSARGSVRGLLLWLGMLGYSVYNYAYYLLGARLNVVFPLYVVLAVLSVFALVLTLRAIDVDAIATSFSAKTPHRLVGGYLVFVAACLGLVWMGMWAAHEFAGAPTPVEPEAFKLVAALDNTMMIPVLALGGVLLWRRRAWGYVVAAIAGVQASIYLLVLSVNSYVAIARGLAKAPGEIPIWGSLAILTTAATVALFVAAGGRAER